MSIGKRTNLSNINQPNEQGVKGGVVPNQSANVLISKESTDLDKEIVKKGEPGLVKLVDFSSVALFRCKSVFPFDLIPTEVIIDINKVTISTQLFSFGRRMHSFVIDDVSDVFVTSGIFLATLEIIDKNFGSNTVKVPKLNPKEALEAKRIIQGLVIAKKMEIDYKLFDSVEGLKKKLISLGSSPQ